MSDSELISELFVLNCFENVFNDLLDDLLRVAQLLDGPVAEGQIIWAAIRVVCGRHSTPQVRLLVVRQEQNLVDVEPAKGSSHQDVGNAVPAVKDVRNEAFNYSDRNVELLVDQKSALYVNHRSLFIVASVLKV